MKHIAILSASIRPDRKSHRVALYLKKFLESRNIAKVNLIDLKDLNFPIFKDRLSNLKSPGADVIEFSRNISEADGVIIVTPEYNGGYPASLKNVVDLLFSEWKRKPIAISTVSAGAFGGSQVITSLQFALWKIGALVIPAMFPVATIDKSFTEDGEATDPDASDRRASAFVSELVFWIEAKQKASL